MTDGRLRRRLAAIQVAIALLVGSAAPGAVAEETPAPEGKRHILLRIAASAVDVALVRPVGTVAAVGSSIAAVPLIVLSAPMAPESTERVWERFVLERWKYVVTRPIGDL